MEFGVEAARARVLEAMKTGKWDIVEDYLTRYAGAVRAEERYHVVGEAMEAAQATADEGDETGVGEQVVAALARLR